MTIPTYHYNTNVIQVKTNEANNEETKKNLTDEKVDLKRGMQSIDNQEKLQINSPGLESDFINLQQSHPSYYQNLMDEEKDDDDDVSFE